MQLNLNVQNEMNWFHAAQFHMVVCPQEALSHPAHLAYTKAARQSPSQKAQPGSAGQMAE
jgi:hypothetical protein